jgi:hypothetical protein
MSTDSTGSRVSGTRQPSHETEGFRLADDTVSEHILLESDSPDLHEIQQQPRTPQQHFHLMNRSHALETELILFEGGWLSIRQHRRRKPGEAKLINLRFVDAEPEITRYISRRSLYATCMFASLGLASGALAYSSKFMTVTVPATILLLFASGVMFATCAYRTQKRVVFYTKTGRAQVISLLATLGSFKLLRTIVPQIRDAIIAASGQESATHEGLRSEMREHYRMRESGIIDESVCSTSTQKILSEFK